LFECAGLRFACPVASRFCPEFLQALAGRIALFALITSQGIFDGDLLLQTGGFFSRRNLEHAVEIEIELDDDLVAGRHGGQPFDTEFADRVVMAYVLVFALVDVDLDDRLSVVNGAEDFAPRGRYRSIAGTNRSETKG